MRILIDATPLLLRSAGVKNYLYHWLRHLRAQAGAHSVEAFPYLGDVGELNHEGSVIGAWATVFRLGLLYFSNVPGNPALERISSGADVFHVTNQVRNPPRGVRLTATVHDMTCWLMPQLHTAANVRADRSYAERTLRRAAGLIAVSENTKRDTVQMLDVPEERISVIYPGVVDAFSPQAAGSPAERRYILYVGTIEPRKNVDALLDAYLALAEPLRREFDLVIAGPPGWAAEKTMARLTSGIPGVRYLGYVSEEKLPGLTARASLFAYPSLYEGFGFPVAQAMACGVPVLTSNVSSLPEVAGEGALLVDPRSAGELTSGLQKLLEDEGLRSRLGQAGQERAKRTFRWEQSAAQSLRFFERVI